MSALSTHRRGATTVTVGPVGEAVGRAWVDCSCGVTQTRPHRAAANRAALRHQHAVGGCVCPSWVVDHPQHPDYEETAA